MVGENNVNGKKVKMSKQEMRIRAKIDAEIRRWKECEAGLAVIMTPDSVERLKHVTAIKCGMTDDEFNEALAALDNETDVND